MRIAQHGITLILAITAGAAFFWQPAQPVDNPEVAQIFNCAQLQHMSWSEISAQQQRFADACDSAEANRNWELTYGRLSTHDVAAAAVHDPL